MKRSLEYLVTTSSLFLSGCYLSLKNEECIREIPVQDYQKTDYKIELTVISPLFIIEFDKEKENKKNLPDLRVYEK